MATILLGAALVVGCSMSIGQGLCLLAGRERWAWWAPGAGFAAMLFVAGLLIRAPGHSKTAAVVIAAATLASLAPGRVRAALLSALPDAVPVALFTLLAAALPFFVSGRAGILGEGVNNDTGAHLGTVWWLEYQRGPAPVGALGGALVHTGYPFGPHGLAGALSFGQLGLVHTFDAVIIAVVPLTALVALGALGGARRGARWVAAVLVGVCYLGASFTMQASFKEPIEGLLVIAAVLAARDLAADLRDVPGGVARRGVPLGVIAGSGVWVYSYGGLLWTVGAAAFAALAAAPLRAWLRVLRGFTLAALVVVAPAIPAVIAFASSPFNNESGQGNLVHALNPLEGLGVWPGSDFRWTPNPLWPTIVLGSLAGVAAIVAIARLLRARDAALPAALVPVLAIYAYANGEKSIYLSAKALTIAAPLLALVIAAGLVRRANADSRAPRRGVPGAASVARMLLAIVVAAAAGWSSFLVLRDGRVGPTAHAAELAKLRPRIARGGAVLFMPKEDLVQWELVGLPVFQGRAFYAPLRAAPRPSKPSIAGGFIDFDSFLPSTLDKFRWAITTRGPFQSAAPRNWKLITQTRSFALWRRRGLTPYRIPADFPTRPGRVLRCRTQFGRDRIGGAGQGFAAVLPRPIVGEGAYWHGQPRNAGERAWIRLRVPRGRWDVSLEYGSMTGLSVVAPGLRAEMPATIDRVGPFYFVGTLDRPRAGRVTIRVTAKPLNAFGRLLGSPGTTRALDTPGHRPLNAIALTRHGEHVLRVQPQQACNRWVDYVQPPGSPGAP